MNLGNFTLKVFIMLVNSYSQMKVIDILKFGNDKISLESNIFALQYVEFISQLSVLKPYD